MRAPMGQASSRMVWYGAGSKQQVFVPVVDDKDSNMRFLHLGALLPVFKVMPVVMHAT